MKKWMKTMVMLCIMIAGVFVGNTLDVQAVNSWGSPESDIYLEAERDIFFSTESFSITDNSVYEGVKYEWEVTYRTDLSSSEFPILPGEYYAISEDGRTLTFDGVALDGFLTEDSNIQVMATKWLPEEAGGQVETIASLNIQFKDPVYRYEEDEEQRLLIVDDFPFYDTTNFYVRDMYHPEGEHVRLPYFSIEEVGNDILEIGERDDRGIIRVKPTGVGETSLVLSYNRYENDINGDKTDVLYKTYKFIVTDVDYTIDYSWYADGVPVEQVLQGETVQLKTIVTAQKYDFDGSFAEAVLDPSLVLEVEDKHGDYWEMISQSAGEFSSGKMRYTRDLTVKAGAADGLWNNLAGYTLRAYVGDAQVKAWDAWVEVKDSVYRIEISEETEAVFDANLEINKRETFVPTLKQYTKTDTGIEETIIENITFSTDTRFMSGSVNEDGSISVIRYYEDKPAELTLTAQTEDGEEVSATWKFPPLVEIVPEEIIEGFGTEEVYRVAGASRYETSYETANVLKEQLGVDQFDTAIIAYGKNFPDALAGSYLAGKTDAPILMINENYADELTAYVKENVKEGSKIYVLGGEGAIPQEQLSGLGEYDLCRLAGKTRYETNLMILEEAGVTDQDILVCTGKNFADSLSASATGNPIFLVNNKELTDDQKAFLEAHKGNHFYIIGGTGAVSEEMEAQIAEYGETKRISGASRYETSVKLAEEFFDNAKIAVLASAKNYPDGLCGGPLAMSKNAPLILTATGKEAAAVKYLNDNNIGVGAVLGGASLISDEVVAKIFELESVNEITKWK